MALNDNATFVASGAKFYFAPEGTEKPTDYDSIPATWVEIGHTDLEEVGTLEGEGGEVTVLGTLQNKSLRTITSSKTFSWLITLKQFDADSVKMYFGSNATVNSDGTVTPSDNPVPTKGAFLGVLRDAAIPSPLIAYGRATEISAADNIELSAEELSSLPLRVTFLTKNGAAGPLDFGLVDIAPATP